MEENKKREVLQVPIDDILPNRFQPRLTFDEKELQDLANSILRYGVIQPIVLRPLGEKYEIVAGERRYKASVMAGLNKIPAILIDTDDDTSAEIALLENLQRKNLTVIEEAQSYMKLIEKGFTQDDIATKLGVSQSSIANKIRLLNLPQEIQNALLYNRISERHARCLLTVKDPDLQINLLNKIINEKLTVKQTEEEINIINNKDKIMQEELPSDIQNFLNPKPKEKIEKQDENNNDNIEVIDFKIPEVIDIEESVEQENNDEYENINPFQDVHKDLIEKLDSTRNEISEEEHNIDNNIENTDAYEEENIINEDEDLTLPVIINKVRDFVRNLDKDELISIDEVDLADTYQIIININKK